MTPLYPQVMPTIKPYPQQLQPQLIHSTQYPHHQQQKLINLSVYRPAYHRIPSTPISPHHQKDVWATASPEVSPIVVPSMSPATLHPQFLNFYTGVYHQQPIVHTNYSQIPQPQTQQAHIDMNQVPPIHHTLENATITYDTIQHNLLKELVKDVFFSPAMTTDSDIREMSPSGSLSSSFSVSAGDNDSIFSAITPPFSPYEQSPSEFLLEQDTLFEFGLDLATTCNISNQTTTSSYKEIKVASATANYFISNDNQQQQNKRRCSDSILQERKKKKQRQDLLSQLRSTSPGSSCDKIHIESDEANAFVGSSRFNTAHNTSTTEADYNGYRFECKKPRRDVTPFANEFIDEKERPILQKHCSACQRNDSWKGNALGRCEGCPKAYHQKCCVNTIHDDAFIDSKEPCVCGNSGYEATGRDEDDSQTTT
ncbi:hypothetical protein BD408DRAFT_446289 [Parasitella parasitica]|nr:hypothetical protein BD408DRAFT_446289 [Parasitella parasitica]